MMTRSKSPEENLMRIESVRNIDLITTTSSSTSTPPKFPTWKLYENPFYTNSSSSTSTPHYPSQQKQKQKQSREEDEDDDEKQQRRQIHRLQLPISTRKIGASFWDLTFIKPLMESELEVGRAKITELKAELERERKARKKAESRNKKLGRELWEVKKRRETLERLCEELGREISIEKAEIDRMRKDMEEERKMLRVAEVLREERLQMKLADAKLLLMQYSNSKCCSLLHPPPAASKQTVKHGGFFKQPPLPPVPPPTTATKANCREYSNANSGVHETQSCGVVLAEKPASTINTNAIADTNIIINGSVSSIPSCWRRRSASSPEPENPHIKRGIKGFVEFPKAKVVRALGSKTKTRPFGFGHQVGVWSKASASA